MYEWNVTLSFTEQFFWDIFKIKRMDRICAI